MWRYLVGAGAALLLAGAGLFFFRGTASTEPLLPPSPASGRQAAAEQALPDPPQATERTREQKRFGRYDKDRDGIITREEYLAGRRKAFAKLDTNGDGRLSFDEWAIKTTTRFAGADADRSGTLTPAEFATTAPKRKPNPRPRCDCGQPAPAPAANDDE